MKLAKITFYSFVGMIMIFVEDFLFVLTLFSSLLD